MDPHRHSATQLPGRRYLAATLLGISWPLMLNNLFNIGINAADTLMAGHLGASQLAAVALGSSIWISLFLAGLGVIMAIGPTVAQYYGARNFHAISTTTHQGFWLAIVVAAAVIAAMHSMAPLMRKAGIEEHVIILTEGYLSAMSWGVLGCYWYHCLRQMNEGLGRTIPIMIVMGTSLPINVSLNYVFMYGHFGAPQLGAVGAGLGSGITFWVMFIFIALYTKYAAHYHPYALWGVLSRPDPQAMKQLLKIGAPIGLSFMLQAGLFTAVAFIMGGLGTEVVAAHAVTLNFASLVFMIPLALGMASTALVGQAIGRGEPRYAKKLGETAMLMAFGFMCITATVTALFARQIALIYTSDGQVVSLAASLLLIAAVLQLGDGTQAAASGALRGLKDTTVPMLFNAVAYWLIGFSVAYYLAVMQRHGGIGVWIGLSGCIWLAAGFMIWRFAIVTKRRIAATVIR